MEKDKNLWLTQYHEIIYVKQLFFNSNLDTSNIFKNVLIKANACIYFAMYI